MVKKIKDRKKALAELIGKYAIEDQDTIVDLLKSDYEIETNQSIISRDLRQLGITKQKVNDKLVYALKEEDPHLQLLPLAIKNIDHNEAIIAITTHPGLAAFVSEYIDMQEEPDILATLAGENIVLVIPKTITNIDNTYKKICRLVRKKVETEGN